MLLGVERMRSFRFCNRAMRLLGQRLAIAKVGFGR